MNTTESTLRYTIADAATTTRSADIGVDLTDSAFVSQEAAESALAALEDSEGLYVRELRFTDLVGDELAAAESLIEQAATEHGAEAARAGSATDDWTIIPEASWDDLMDRLGARFGIDRVGGYGRTGRVIARRYLDAFNEAVRSAA